MDATYRGRAARGIGVMAMSCGGGDRCVVGGNRDVWWAGAMQVVSRYGGDAWWA
jgi:hypothetical protein